MSYAAERWARAQVAGNARAKAVLIELAHCFNGRTGQCTPSVAYLSRITELKQDTITKATNDLQDRGLIVKTVIKTKSGRACSYRLVGFVASEWDQPENEDTPKNGDTHKVGGTRTPKNGVTGVPENGVTHTPENGDRTGNKNKEIEQGKITRDIGAPDHFRDVTKKVEMPKKEKRPNRWVLVDRPEGVSPEAWKNFCQIRAVKRIPLTETAWKGIEKEAAKAGLSLSETIDICNEHGWAGFKNSWLQNANRSTGSTTVRHTDPQYGIGVCRPPKEPTRMFTPEEAEETRRQMMEEGLIF